jgi:hypothetical protein
LERYLPSKTPEMSAWWRRWVLELCAGVMGARLVGHACPTEQAGAELACYALAPCIVYVAVMMSRSRPAEWMISGAMQCISGIAAYVYFHSHHLAAVARYVDDCYRHIRRWQQQQQGADSPHHMLADAAVLELVSAEQLLHCAGVRLVAVSAGKGDAEDQRKHLAKLKSLGYEQVCKGATNGPGAVAGRGLSPCASLANSSRNRHSKQPHETAAATQQEQQQQQWQPT